MVVGYTDRPDGDRPDDGAHLDAEVVRLTVDRDTGRAAELVRNRTFVEMENGTAVERHSSHKVVTYTDYGSPQVDRPEAIGPRGPVEWLWDVVYY